MVRLISLLVACLIAASGSYYAMTLWLDQAPSTATAAIPRADTQEVRKAAQAMVSCVASGERQAQCAGEAATLSGLLNADTLKSFVVSKTSDFFEMYLFDGIVVLRKAACSPGQIAGHHVAWSAWSKSKTPQTENEEKFGQFGAFHSIDRELRNSGRDCVMALQLPLQKQDLRRLSIGLLDPSKSNSIWQSDLSLGPSSTAKKL